MFFSREVTCLFSLSLSCFWSLTCPMTQYVGEHMLNVQDLISSYTLFFVVNLPKDTVCG